MNLNLYINVIVCLSFMSDTPNEMKSKINKYDPVGASLLFCRADRRPDNQADV